MSYTNQTTNLGLPQYIGTDIPSILTDVNGAFAKIDTAYGEQANKIAESTQNSEQAKSLASAAQAQAQAASNEVASVSNRVKTLEDSIDAVEETANNANTTAQAASTAAGVAKNTADTALSNAATAQSTANTALANANSATVTANSAQQAVANLSNGTSGAVAFLALDHFNYRSGGVEYSRNYNGTQDGFFFAKHDVPTIGNPVVTGLAIMSGQITISSDSPATSITVGSETVFPLLEVQGNPFGLQRTNSTHSLPPFRLWIGNNTTYLPAYVHWDGSYTYFSVTGLTASLNSYRVDPMIANFECY